MFHLQRVVPPTRAERSSGGADGSGGERDVETWSAVGVGWVRMVARGGEGPGNGGPWSGTVNAFQSEIVVLKVLVRTFAVETQSDPSSFIIHSSSSIFGTKAPV